MWEIMGISNKIKEIRKKENMTQEDFARKIFVSRQAVSKWEQGKGTPSLANLEEISKTFHCSMDELLFKEDLFLESKKNSFKGKIIFAFTLITLLISIIAIVLCCIFLPLSSDEYYARIVSYQNHYIILDSGKKINEDYVEIIQGFDNKVIGIKDIFPNDYARIIETRKGPKKRISIRLIEHQYETNYFGFIATIGPELEESINISDQSFEESGSLYYFHNLDFFISNNNTVSAESQIEQGFSKTFEHQLSFIYDSKLTPTMELKIYLIKDIDEETKKVSLELYLRETLLTSKTLEFSYYERLFEERTALNQTELANDLHHIFLILKEKEAPTKVFLYQYDKENKLIKENEIKTRMDIPLQDKEMISMRIFIAYSDHSISYEVPSMNDLALDTIFPVESGLYWGESK